MVTRGSKAQPITVPHSCAHGNHGKGYKRWLLTFIWMALVLHTVGSSANALCPECALNVTQCWGAPVSLSLSPAFPKVGHPIIFTCTITPEYIDKINSSHLYIYKKKNDFNVSHPNVEDHAEDGQISLTVKSPEHDAWRGAVNCKVYDHPGFEYDCVNFIERARILVVFRRDPLPITFRSCVVNNWENLCCDWLPTWHEQKAHTLTSNTEHNFTYSFHYNRLQRPLEQHGCKMASNESCTLTQGASDRNNNFIMGQVYRLMVHATTEHNFSRNHFWSDQYRENYNTSMHVKPNAPGGLTHVVKNGSTILTWSSPNTSWAEASSWLLNYTVTVGNSWDSNLTELFTIDTYLILPTHPYTTYTCDVTVIPTHGGYSSKLTTYNFTTAQTEPKVVTQVSSVGYKHVGGKVRVYWKPLHPWEQGGDDFQYVLLSKDRTETHLSRRRRHSNNSWVDNNTNRRGEWKRILMVPDVTSYTADIPVEDTGDLEIVIATRNIQGDGPIDESNTIQVRASVSKLDKTERLLIEGHTDVNAVDMTLKGSIPGAEYIVFWHRKDGKGPVDWLSLATPLSGTPSTTGVTSSSKATPNTTYTLLQDKYTMYNFSLARKDEGNLGNTGISWENCDIFPYDGIADAVTEIRIIPEQHELEVNWHAPSTTAYIQYYHVQYCTCDREHKQCKAGHFEKMVKVRGDYHETVLVGLKDDTTHCVVITSLTRNGESLPSDVYVVTTKKGLSTGAIAGITVAGVIGVLLLCIGAVYFYRKCVKAKKWYTSGLKVQLPPEPQYRDPYHRTLSSMSNTSMDSGRFSLALDDYASHDELTLTPGSINGYTRTGILSSPEIFLETFEKN